MFQKMRLFRIFSVYFHAVPVCPCHCPHGHPAAEAPTPGPASALVPGPAPCRLPDEPCRSHRAGQGRWHPRGRADSQRARVSAGDSGAC